jgi:hypothetical protein
VTDPIQALYRRIASLIYDNLDCEDPLNEHMAAMLIRELGIQAERREFYGTYGPQTRYVTRWEPPMLAHEYGHATCALPFDKEDPW